MLCTLWKRTGYNNKNEEYQINYSNPCIDNSPPPQKKTNKQKKQKKQKNNVFVFYSYMPILNT